MSSLSYTARCSKLQLVPIAKLQQLLLTTTSGFRYLQRALSLSQKGSRLLHARFYDSKGAEERPAAGWGTLYGQGNATTCGDDDDDFTPYATWKAG
jgi:hypothetical protein